MTWQEWFRRNNKCKVKFDIMTWHAGVEDTTVEDFYQAFKARMIEELEKEERLFDAAQR